jgi:TctA family transporter
MISSYLSSLQRIQEEVVQPNIAIVGLIERNMYDHKTADMIDVAVHEIVEHKFQDLELAMRYLIVGSMLGYMNQNSCHSPV